MVKKITRKGIRCEIGTEDVTIVGLSKKDIIHVYIPDEIDGLPVKWIYAHAFVGCAFQTVSLPEGITRIPNAVFYKCYALREITFRGIQGDVEIYQCGIGYCTNLTTITSDRPIKLVYGAASIQECPKLTI